MLNVQLQIVGAPPAGDNVWFSIPRQVLDDQIFGGHATGIHHVFPPTAAISGRAGVDDDAKCVRSVAVPEHNFVAAITVQIGRPQSMATLEIGINHVPIP